MDIQTKKSFRENYHCTINSMWTTIKRSHNCEEEENHFIFRIGNLLKTFNKKHHTGEVKFSLPVKQKHMSSLLPNKIS